LVVLVLYLVSVGLQTSVEAREVEVDAGGGRWGLGGLSGAAAAAASGVKATLKAAKDGVVNSHPAKAAKEAKDTLLNSEAAHTIKKKASAAAAELEAMRSQARALQNGLMNSDIANAAQAFKDKLKGEVARLWADLRGKRDKHGKQLSEVTRLRQKKERRRARMRAAVWQIYTRHQPEKLEAVPALLEKYEGRECVLAQKLITKYLTKSKGAKVAGNGGSDDDPEATGLSAEEEQQEKEKKKAARTLAAKEAQERRRQADIAAQDFPKACEEGEDCSGEVQPSEDEDDVVNLDELGDLDDFNEWVRRAVAADAAAAVELEAAEAQLAQSDAERQLAEEVHSGAVALLG
jgi:hypothetical protein